MAMHVIGTGVGRTGTYSLKIALNELDLGPCYHMEEVILHMGEQLPLWQAAVQGRPDWAAIFKGYRSAVDWPTAGFFRELYAAFPEAKFVHTVRSPESWAASFSETIHKLAQGKDQAPPPMRPWLEMAVRVVEKNGFAIGSSPAQLSEAFEKNTAAVRAAIPQDRLLVFDVKDGWAPLCAFLGVPVPGKPFPRSNSREEFWEKVKGAAG
jgi:hypothetical protein